MPPLRKNAITFCRGLISRLKKPLPIAHDYCPHCCQSCPEDMLQTTNFREIETVILDGCLPKPCTARTVLWNFTLKLCLLCRVEEPTLTRVLVQGAAYKFFWKGPAGELYECSEIPPEESLKKISPSR